MKEHIQKTGVRKYAGGDLIELQAEPLKAIQSFFKEYEDCIINGCEVVAAGSRYNVTPGLVSLRGTDAGGNATAKVAEFAGVADVVLPVFLTLTNTVSERVYGDGKVKPVAYNYTAIASGVRPAAGIPCLEITAAGGRRFVDAVKITEKLDKTGNGRDVTVTFSQAATRENIASGEKLTIILGKIIRWLADLKALAFKDKVSKTDMDTALQGELDGKLSKGSIIKVHQTLESNYSYLKSEDAALNISKMYIGTCYGYNTPVNAIEIMNGNVNVPKELSVKENKVWHSGNFNPATKVDTTDSRLSNARSASDVSAWAKAASKPNYNFNEINYFSFERLPLNSPQRKKLFYSMSEHGYLSFVAIGANRRGDSWGRGLFSVGTNDAGTTYTDFEFDVNGKIYSPAGTFALTSDIPVSLPANGGRADDANKLLITGEHPNFGRGLIMNQGIDIPGAPNRTDYFNYLRLLHNNPAGYFSELAMPFTNSTRMYYRTMSSGTLGPWNPIAFLSDIPTTLPANGGNADTVGGKRASDFATVNVNGNQNLNNLNGFGMLSNPSDNLATSENNYPTRQAGMLIYGNAAGGSANQLYGTYYSNRWFARGGGSAPGQKTAWKEFAMLDPEGNLSIDTTTASYIALKRNNESVAYMGLGSPTKKDILLQLYKSGNFIRIGEDGKNYSNTKEIATVDQIKALSGGATATAGQYISGIAVNDHEITVTKAALPTSDLGGIGANGVNWDTFTTPGANWTNSMGWGTNAPNTNNMNGLLIVSRSGNCIVQCYEPSDASGAFKRVKPLDGYWSDWKQCAMKSDFNTANIAESANKRFMSDAQEAKLDGGLEVAFAGVVDANGVKVKSKGRPFDVQKNGYGLFTVTHNENDAFLIVQVMSEGGQVSIAHTFTTRTFKVDSYAGAGGDTNGRGFRFVAYKL